jgi:hypothetical protein
MQYSLEQVEKAKPIIANLLNGGEIKAVEGSQEEICLMLDRTCGIDYFQIYPKTGLIWGIGSRFQKTYGKPFNTFTVRRSRESGAETEFIKRLYAIKHNCIYPQLTMQGYYSDKTGEILSLAIAKTKDIMQYILDNKQNIKVQYTHEDKIGQASFFIVNWQDFMKQGYKCLVWEC